MKVPQPPRTGNPISDGDADARRECFMTIIDVLQEDPSEVLPTFNELTKRLLLKAKQLQCDGDKFTNLTVFGKTEEDFATSFILSRSDTTLSDLVKAKQHDAGAVQQLLQYMLQYSANLRYPQEATVKEVTSRIFSSRDMLMGQRLRKFKSSGGFLSSGAVNWKKGSYELRFTEDVLTEITHRSGEAVTLDATIRIDKGYSLHMNWDDFGAHLAKPPMPNVNLAAFFKKNGSGPWRHKRLAGQSKDFNREVQAVFNQWRADMDAAGKKQEDLRVASSVAAEALKEVETDKRKQSLQQARETAQTKIAEVKRRRTIVFNACVSVGWGSRLRDRAKLCGRASAQGFACMLGLGVACIVLPNTVKRASNVVLASTMDLPA